MTSNPSIHLREHGLLVTGAGGGPRLKSTHQHPVTADVAVVQMRQRRQMVFLAGAEGGPSVH